MEITDRFNEGMNGKVWTTIMSNSVEFKAANCEGSRRRKRCARNEAVFDN